MNRITAFALVCLTTMTVATATSGASAWSLLPQPVHARPAGSQLVTIANGAVIAVRGADQRQVQEIVDRFVQLVADTRGLRLRAATETDTRPVIVFEVNPRANVVGDAGYRIVVGDQGI